MNAVLLLVIVVSAQSLSDLQQSVLRGDYLH